MTIKSQRRPSSHIQLPLWVVGLITAFVIGFILMTSIWLFRTIRDQVANLEVISPRFDLSTESNTTLPASTTNGEMPAPIRQDNLLPAISPESMKPWSGQERVTVLLLGIDRRKNKYCDESGPTRTDSMMILTLDPVGLTAAALSLPRDLWVEIPGYGVDRINQAHYLGELLEYPGGGPALAVTTVEKTLGINIDYYATINFDGFVQFIDHIGGIQINVPEAIDDNKYPDICYGYEPFKLNAGRQQMDGQTALRYARTRSTSGGDVDRASRQQQVLLAVRDQVMQLNMIPKLILESPQLWQTFQDSIRTNMTLNEALPLALLTQDIPRTNINTAVLNYEYVAPYTTPDGQQVLVPVRENIRALRDQLFRPPAIPTPIVDNLVELVATEKAKVKVINGTQTFGLAGLTQEYLLAHHINIVEIGNADASTYRTTQIIDYANKPYTSMYLTQLMSLPPLNISAGKNPDGDYDILVIIGHDWQIPQE